MRRALQLYVAYLLGAAAVALRPSAWMYAPIVAISLWMLWVVMRAERQRIAP